MYAATTHEGRRGAPLLLEHCTAVARLEDVEHARPRASDRLEALIGGQLATFLVRSLASQPGRGLRRLFL
jgi:hypothetical protein